jgi:hypothetical protein
MAITRAQQYRQMLEDGGMLVQPSMTGKRPGYRGDDAAKSTGAAQSGRADSPSTSGGSTGSGGRDDTVDPRRVRESREEFETAVGKSNLEKLYKDGVPKSNLPGFLGLGLNATKKFRDFTLRKNIDYFEGLKSRNRLQNYPPTLEGYTQYMKDRSAGTIDAAGNPIIGGDDNDSFIPVDTTSTQSSTEEVLSPIQQAILDRGTPSAFLATGGRVAFRGGDAARSDAASGRNAGRADPDTRGSGPSGTDDRGSDVQNSVQAAIRAGVSPKDINRITNPSVIDKIRSSRFNNPITRGILRTGLYTLNPALGPLDFRRAMQIKELYDYTTDQINNPVSEEDLTLGLEDEETELEKENNPENVSLGTGLAEQAKQTIIDRQAQIEEAAKALGYADGGRIGAMEGGIMDLESGRQMYFLGKLVKKATRAVKKIVKSPIGKAALFAAPFLMNPALRTGIGTFLKTKAAPFLFEEGASFAKGNIGLGELLKGGLTGGGSLALGGALTLAPLLFQEDTNDDEYQKFLRERGASAQLPAPIPTIRNQYRDYMARAFVADGGTPEPVAKKTMPLLDMDGKEMDLRAEGGFVPIGRMEKADDVPARLSKNEFVFTADAVRNAGDGDVDKGAEVMYNMMKNLESGGDVSEESQGLEGARRMFQTSQRLEEVL